MHVTGTGIRKESQRIVPHSCFSPFLLKIDPNTLYIIQKFHSLVAATRKPGPVALISRHPFKGLAPREQWLGLRMPTMTAHSKLPTGWGLF